MYDGIVVTLGQAASRLTYLKLSSMQLTTEKLHALAQGRVCLTIVLRGNNS